MTQKEFYEEICRLPEKFKNRDLETYLSALLMLLEKQEQENMDADKLLYLIHTAFASEPKKFDTHWYSLKIAPDDKSTNPYFTSDVLKFQIAELHKMQGKQLINEMRYFGITSETGNVWYNFDPFTNFECGVKCLIDRSENEEQEFIVNDQTLGEILEMGRIYE